MAYPISLVSNSSKSGKTTIALNIAILLASSNKKILLFNLKTKTPFSKLLTNVLPSNNKNIIKPLVLFQYNKNLSLMFLDNEINLKKHD
jgi:MinD-like ATPase involved in chromosome partitioning or flagellar assembly